MDRLGSVKIFAAKRPGSLQIKQQCFRELLKGKSMRKKIKNISWFVPDNHLLFFIILAVTSFLCIQYFLPNTHVFAAFFDKVTGSWEETINTGIGKSINTVFSQNSDIYEALITNNAIISPVYNVLAGFAAAIAVLFIYINVIQEVIHGQDKVESFIRGLIKGIIVVILVLFLPRILTELENLGNGLYDALTGAMSETLTDDPDIGFKASVFSEKKGLGGFLARVVGTFFPWMLAELSIIVAQVLAYSILIELTIRKMFSPLAVANISIEGFRGPGLRWFKRYIALYIRMIIIYALSYVNTVMLTVIVQQLSGVKAAFGVIVVNFTIVSMMIKSSELANEIMGT